MLQHVLGIDACTAAMHCLLLGSKPACGLGRKATWGIDDA